MVGSFVKNEMFEYHFTDLKGIVASNRDKKFSVCAGGVIHAKV